MGFDGIESVRLTVDSVEDIESLLGSILVEIRELRNDLRRRVGESDVKADEAES